MSFDELLDLRVDDDEVSFLFGNFEKWIKNYIAFRNVGHPSAVPGAPSLRTRASFGKYNAVAAKVVPIRLLGDLILVQYVKRSL